MTGLHVVIGSGVLGRAIAAQLVAEGRVVRLVSRTAVPAAGVEVVRAEVMDPEAARRACEGAAVVYHCAAPAYHRWVEDFPPLQDRIVEAAAVTGAVLVVAENLYGYGVAGRLTEDMPLAATTRKGAVRAAMTGRLFDRHARGDLRVVVGRAADFFGPGVRMSIMGERLWPGFLDGGRVDWTGDPDAPHSLTYVPDFARALIRLGRAEDAWGQAWHVPTLPALSPRAVLGLAAGLAGLPAPRIRLLPVWVVRVAGLFDPAAREVVEMLYSQQAAFEMDDAKWRSRFDDRPTGWTEALEATLRYWSAAR